MTYELPSDWRMAAVTELGVIAGGPFGSSLGRKDYVERGVPVIRGGNLGTDEPFDPSELVFVSDEKADALSRNLALPGDVLFTQRGTLGQVGLVPAGPYARYVISQSQMRLRVDPDVADAEFVYAAFRSPAMLREIHNRAISVGVPHINLGILGELEIPLPPVEEQRRIATVLGALDSRIALESCLSERLQLVGATSFRHALGSCDKRVALGEFAEIHKAAVQPAKTPDALFEHYSIPAFDSGALPVLERGEAMLSGKTQLPSSDCVLLSKLNPITPRVWWPAPTGLAMAVCSPEFVVLVPKSDIPAPFLYAAVRDDLRFQQEVIGRATGTTGSRQRIRPGDLLACRVAAPSPQAIASWSEAMTPLYRRAQHALSTGARLRAIRDQLLPKLVSGSARVSVDYAPGVSNALAAGV